MRCHEVLSTWDGAERFVCEGERFTEHSHADPAPYIRPLQKDEEVTEPDKLGCVFLRPRDGEAKYEVL
jgi:hypothetical protein